MLQKGPIRKTFIEEIYQFVENIYQKNKLSLFALVIRLGVDWTFFTVIQSSLLNCPGNSLPNPDYGG